MSIKIKEKLVEDLLEVSGGIPFLNDYQAAKVLSISYLALKNKVYRSDPLPPYFKVPKLRQRRWPVREFATWLSKYYVDQ